MFNCMIWSTEYSNPVIIVENRMLYKNKGIVNYDKSYSPDIRILEKGKDITILSVSHTSLEVSRAISALKERGLV